jgi:large subunit ribosomal protein L10
MNTEEKKLAVGELTDLFKGAEAAYLLSYKGSNASQMTSMRRELRASGATFAVVKNTLAKKALSDLGTTDLSSYFKGPVAVVWAKGDFVTPAKIISKHSKENDKLSVTAGLVEGKVVDGSGFEAIATLPSREEILSKLLALINTPATKLVQMLNAPASKLVRTIDAWRAELEKKA